MGAEDKEEERRGRGSPTGRRGNDGRAAIIRPLITSNSQPSPRHTPPNHPRLTRPIYAIYGRAPRRRRVGERHAEPRTSDRGAPQRPWLSSIPQPHPIIPLRSLHLRVSVLLLGGMHAGAASRVLS
ncbi:hypothetical protein OH77DRAFT_312470 [Trametes cingulata]|nr:hypothetical protein OH77DRAFT_312470 [Trametes cingulata]